MNSSQNGDRHIELRRRRVRRRREDRVLYAIALLSSCLTAATALVGALSLAGVL